MDTFGIQDFRQDVLPRDRTTLTVRRYTKSHAGDLVSCLSDLSTVFGVALMHAPDGPLLLLADGDRIHVLAMASDTLRLPKPLLRLLSGELTDTSLVGFGFGAITVQVWSTLQTRVRGVNLSTLSSLSAQSPSKVIKHFLGIYLDGRDAFLVDRLWHSTLCQNEESFKNGCMRAWLAFKVGDACRGKIDQATRIDTSLVSRQELILLAKFHKEQRAFNELLPTEIAADFSEVVARDGEFQVSNSRYATRIRKSTQSMVLMTDRSGREFYGRATRTQGRTTGIKFAGASHSNIADMKVVGRNDPTNSEKAREDLMYQVLIGQKRLSDTQLVRFIWFPTTDDMMTLRTSARETDTYVGGNLNNSQQEVVLEMTSSRPMVLVHGPPGTGKTTTMAAAAQIWGNHHRPVYLVAHSNVAVKNIAEKLHDHGIDFKIIVSKDFYVEWHEHIYKSIEERLIRSDELPDNPTGLARVLLGSQIILSTISMLSNPCLENNGMFRLVPMERLIIDEASQINVFEYLTLLVKFPSLQKLCFFGDPNQLPPYGQDRVPELQSIFEVKYLRESALLLNTQYRMPAPLGNFISLQIYDSKLRSQHSVQTLDCLKFVNVASGEQSKAGFSWVNHREVDAIVDLVRLYYRHTDFCVITPYDAQRAAIEAALRRNQLPWESVYNVDSFQGNEEKYVLISVVRTDGPGFLSSKNRMNVMLTRCKRGMVIVTKQLFLRGSGRSTLLGRLAQFWERNWERNCPNSWVSSREVQEGTVNLPGAPAPRAIPQPTRFWATPSMSAMDHSIPSPNMTGRTFNVSLLFKARPTQSVQIKPLGLANDYHPSTSSIRPAFQSPADPKSEVDFPSLPVEDFKPSAAKGKWAKPISAKVLAAPRQRPLLQNTVPSNNRFAVLLNSRVAPW